MGQTTIPIVKNAIAGASDVVFQASRLNILGCVTSFPTVNYKAISNRCVIQKSLVETVTINSVSYTPASSTVYEFIITQDITGTGAMLPFRIKYTSDSSATDAEIATNLVTAVNNSGAKITASGAATPLTLTADAGYPLYTITDVSNITSVSTQTAYTPNGTPATALSNVIAPHGTAGTAIAGTSTITVTTAAAHSLRPGDMVQIGSVATLTLTFTDNVPLSNNTTYGKTFSGAAGGKFRVATVPTTTTFTLDGCTGNGGTNSGTITITRLNTATVTMTSTPTIAAGKTLVIANVLTATVAPIVNDIVGTAGTSVTARVGVGVTAGATIVLENVSLDTTNGTSSGTITIKEVAQTSRGDGAVLYANGVTDAVTTNTYSQVQIPNAQYNSNTLDTVQGSAISPLLYYNEGDADYGDFNFRLQNVLEGRVVNTIASPNSFSANS